MADVASIVARVRLEIGDLGDPFRETTHGDGTQDTFDLPVGYISVSTLKVYEVSTAGMKDLVSGTDYTYDPSGPSIVLPAPLPVGATLIAEGTAYALLTDDELTQYVNDAVTQHTYGRRVVDRYRDNNGFIRYTNDEMDITSLPDVEELLVAILATINALWTLTTDASTDIDVDTSDGTHVPRSQRFAQMRSQIDALTARYNDLCQQLNVGLHRIEVFNLRRVSRTTNRLVPDFVEREYDDVDWPVRILPQIDQRDADYDTPPSPVYGMGW